MGSEIHVVDLLRNKTGLLIPSLQSSAIGIDTVEMKLYFENNSHISRAHINGTNVEVIIKNANVNKMAIDWIGRRIFWTESLSKRISVADLDGKERRVLANIIKSPRDIEIDATTG